MNVGAGWGYECGCRGSWYECVPLCYACQTFKTLEEYVLFIRGDPEKQSNLPKDGTVHELTSSVSLSLCLHV